MTKIQFIKDFENVLTFFNVVLDNEEKLNFDSCFDFYAEKADEFVEKSKEFIPEEMYNDYFEHHISELDIFDFLVKSTK